MIINIACRMVQSLLMVISAFIFYQCSCSCINSQSEIPEQVLNKANRYIIAKVGKDYFDKYIRPDFQDSKRIQSKYEMVYNFKIPEKPYVDTKIKFTVDTTGQLINKENVIGLPDCLSSPEKCQFNIDEAQARAIAEKNDFQKGIKEWQVEFKWEPKHDQYVWSILSTLQEATGSFGTRGNGQIMLIDPDTGNIISQNPWYVR